MICHEYWNTDLSEGFGQGVRWRNRLGLVTQEFGCGVSSTCVGLREYVVCNRAYLSVNTYGRIGGRKRKWGSEVTERWGGGTWVVEVCSNFVHQYLKLVHYWNPITQTIKDLFKSLIIKENQYIALYNHKVQ